MLFRFETDYRKFFTDIKKSGVDSRYSINDTVTFFYDVDRSDIEFNYLLSMDINKSKEMISFIQENTPDGNIRVIAKDQSEYSFIFFSIREDRQMAMSLNGGSKENQVRNLAVVYSICKLLSQDNTYLGEQSVCYLNKRTGKECPMTITYLSKSKKPKLRSVLSDNHIEWRHSWKVCGHWRKVSGIGKNRYDERVVIGRTWVKPCIKGSGNLVEKIKVIGG